MIESTRFQQGSLMLVKNKTTDDSWFFRFYEDRGGKRVHRNQRIGSVRDFPRRRDAEKAVLSLRAKINSGVRTPETVTDLITHYKQHELTLERKAFATVDAHNVYIRLYVTPKWGACKLSEVKTVAVEQWLDSLPPRASFQVEDSEHHVRNLQPRNPARMDHLQPNQQSPLFSQTTAGTGCTHTGRVSGFTA